MHRLDVAGMVGRVAQLAPQRRHVDVERPVDRPDSRPPHLFGQLLPADKVPDPAGQRHQQRQLLGGELQRPLVEPGLVALDAAPAPTLNVQTATTCDVMEPAPVLKFRMLMTPADGLFAVMLLNDEPPPLAQLTNESRAVGKPSDAWNVLKSSGEPPLMAGSFRVLGSKLRVRLTCPPLIAPQTAVYS